MAQRPLWLRLWWSSRDFAKRVWDNSAEDNIFFLAGGIAFNILLAIVPLLLLFVSGLSYILNRSADATAAELALMVDRMLPTRMEGTQSPVHRLLGEIIRTRGAVGIWSAVGFIWFSTRLFGSLRSVLAEVFDIENERGIIAGKLFDIRITVIATLLAVAYSALSAYLAIATTRGVRVLAAVGLRQDVMGQLEYRLGQLLAFAFIVLLFFSLYKFLPVRRIRWRTALIAALFTSLMFELAKALFTTYVGQFNPGSLYTGTLAVLVIIVFWVYYAALLFILGGEVAQVYDLRRVRRQQREAFE